MKTDTHLVVVGADAPNRDVPYVWTGQHDARLQIGGAATASRFHDPSREGFASVS